MEWRKIYTNCSSNWSPWQYFFTSQFDNASVVPPNSRIIDFPSLIYPLKYAHVLLFFIGETLRTTLHSFALGDARIPPLTSSKSSTSSILMHLSMLRLTPTLGHRWGFELLKFQLPNHQVQPLESNTPYSPHPTPLGHTKGIRKPCVQMKQTIWICSMIASWMLNFVWLRSWSP